MDINNALSFNGTSSYVDLNTTNLSLTNALTVECWSKNIGTIGTISTIVGRLNTAWTSASTGDFCLLYNGANINVNLSTSSILEQTKSVPFTNSNDWNHFAFTYNGSSLNIYINGILANTFALTGTINASTNKVFIGKRQYSTDPKYLNGYVDEVRIWNIARTQSEIQANYNKRIFGNPTGLIGYWKLDEGTGTTTVNSINSNNATINNCTWITGCPYIIYPKYLIQDRNSILYKFDGTNIVTIGDNTLSDSNFLNNGISDLTVISQSAWSTVFPDITQVKVLMWTDDTNKTSANMIYNTSPYRPIDKLGNSFDIKMYKA
ncbi:LamG domain-containing protein [Clostridium sp. DJ247]|uniref:LamG domain-containing protein n=1 Tax=Clostridium sp. DJ247 TaxID=2726188 RepID=UPI001629B503|nr:LamG domain-containing protein [Clostridium sp. DJ247]MBC2580009.1 LamG domain-containing protein [Clostridium sp. DJ247]